jgi:MarR family
MRCAWWVKRFAADAEDGRGHASASAAGAGTGFDRTLGPRGISATEWRILAALDAHDGATMTELAERVLFKQPTLTKAVDRHGSAPSWCSAASRRRTAAAPWCI